MANGQGQFGFTADIPGAIERGLQFRQAAQLRPLQQQQAQLGLQKQQQGLRVGGLQEKGAQIDLEKAEFGRNVNTALQLDATPDNQKAAFLTEHIRQGERFGRDMTQSKKALDLVNAGEFEELSKGTKQLIDVGVRQGIISAESGSKGFTLGAGQQRFDAQGNVIATGQTAPVKLSSVQQKVQAEGIDPNSTEGQARAREINQGSRTDPSLQAEKAVIPNVLIAGLDQEIAEKGAAAFSAAGGGKDGLKAFESVVDKGTEQQRRIASPQILKSNFPNASPAELNQLQATMDAAKTTESGLKSASKLREDQRRFKKAKVFQERAVELLSGILANDELDDVIGSIEGGIDFRLQDSEAQLIVDIEEATNILTADNMDLMTGVLSETDIKILKNLSGGALNRKRQFSRFVGDVTKLRDKLSSKTVVTADDIEAERNVASQLTPPSGREGGVLNTDAQGNKAFVFPDGSFEEVP